jgi:hypothetical protein
VIRKASFHRWGDAQRLVDMSEVAIHKVEGDGCEVIIDLLREAIG